MVCLVIHMLELAVINLYRQNQYRIEEALSSVLTAASASFGTLYLQKSFLSAP